MKDGQDLRKVPRMPHANRYETHYTVVEDNVRIERFVALELTDLNFQGMGVQTEQALPVDAVVNFDIYFDGDTYNVTAKVLWTKKHQGYYRSGLAFEYIPEALALRVKRYLTDFTAKKYQN